MCGYLWSVVAVQAAVEQEITLIVLAEAVVVEAGALMFFWAQPN